MSSLTTQYASYMYVSYKYVVVVGMLEGKTYECSVIQQMARAEREVDK